MKYVEVREKIQSVLEEINSKKLELNNLNTELTDKNSSLFSISTDKEQELKKVKDEEIKKFEAEVVKPFNDSISKLETNKTKIKAKKDDLLGKITSDNYKLKDKYKNRYNIDSELKVCEDLDEQLGYYYGKEFSTILNLIIDEDNDVPNIKEIIRNVKLLKPSDNADFDLSEFIDNVMDTLNLNGKNEEGQINEQVPIALAMVVAVIVILIFLYPLIPLLALVPLVYNITKSHYFIRAKAYCKTLLDRKDEIQALVDNDINKAVTRDRNKILDQFNYITKKLDSGIHKLEDDSELELEQQRVNFIFNPREVEEKYSTREEILKGKITTLEESVRKVNNDIDSCESSLGSLRIELNKSLANIITEYLGTGEYSIDLPKDYLFDIINNEPIFFELPRESALFFYNTTEELDKFLDLIYYQTIGRLAPTLYKLYYLDYKFMGDKFMFDESLDCVHIGGDSKSNNDLLVNINDELKRRLPILSHYKSIIEYNDFMNKQDCIGEAYVTVLNVYSDLNGLLSESNLAISNIGYKYGIYNYMFIDKSLVSKDNESTFMKLMENVNKFYYIEPSGLKKKCKEFILSKISSDIQ